MMDSMLACTSFGGEHVMLMQHNCNDISQSKKGFVVLLSLTCWQNRSMHEWSFSLGGAVC